MPVPRPRVSPGAAGVFGTLLVLAAAPACSLVVDSEREAPETVNACEGSALLVTPEDPGARGPWHVGARTVTLAGLTAEVWYPAAPGGEADVEKARYDIREHLREGDQGKIPDEDNPFQECDCYRDLPLDEAHGPYPVVLFLHGTGGFRTQTLTQMTHWASRGFVVVAADHPGLELKYALDLQIGGDQAADAKALLDALESPAGDAAFLAGRLASDRRAVVGHSIGGMALSGLGGQPGVRVLIPMAAGWVNPGASLRGTLILGAMDDAVVAYTQQQQGFETSPAPKRLVGLTGAGHLAFSDLCALGREQGGILQVAIDHGIEVNPLIAALAQDGCKEGQLPHERGWAIINHATAAALEEHLACSKTAAASLASIGDVFPEVGEYQEELQKSP